MTESTRKLQLGWSKLAVCVGMGLLIVGLAGAQVPGSSPAPSGPPGFPQQAPTPPMVVDAPKDGPRETPPVGDGPPPRDVFAQESRESAPASVIAPSRFPITIDPKTPAKDLLPPAPKTKSQKPSAFVDDLAQVPELMLAETFGKRPDPNKTMQALAHQVARINHLNASKKDRFVEVLLDERSDLRGLPFVMGDACRLPLARSRHFARSATLVHQSMNAGDNTAAFLQNWAQQCLADDENLGRVRQGMNDHVSPARVAAMMQICGPASENLRLGMAKYITTVSREESTRALANIVLFTPEQEIRNAALGALAARKDKDYTDMLLQGFRYPWPAVAQRAADALVKLERKDLIPQLIGILDEPDPRAPIVKKTDGKSNATVRELVRINHHRNCLMCHAPGQDVTNPSDVLVAEMPVPGQPLPSFNQGGYQSQGLPEILVRIDVTYLRQDFSAMVPVADAAPWPEQQRFDFITRTRTLSDAELKQYQEKFDNLEPGILPCNHKAALSALREMTGKDTAPTAEAWKKLLVAKPGRNDQLPK